MHIIKDAKSQFSILLRARPRYILYSIIGILFLFYGWFYAKSGQISGTEASIFRLFNNLPTAIGVAFLLITIFGTIGLSLVVVIVLMFRRRYAFAIELGLAVILAWIGAKIVKGFAIRARPYEILQNVHVIEIRDTAFGYPSGHMAVATAATLVIGQRLGPTGRRWLYILVALVGLSRIVVGMHAPLDILGGLGVGLIAGSLINFFIGTPTRRFLPSEIAKALKTSGFAASNIKTAKVDARGSAPYFGEINGQPVFIKIVDSDNTIADWLFKFTRRLLYRRLEDELPFFNAKRQLEHEALIALLAHEASIKTPQIIGICHIAGPSWALIQRGLSGASLDKVDPITITDKQLEDVWALVQKLHDNRIAHRDLRTANILRDDKGALWLIDFGFAELSPGLQGVARDCVEMLASLSCLVGPERAVKASRSVLTRSQLAAYLPFVQYSVLSSATTKLLKKLPGGVNALRLEIQKETHQKASTEIVKINRLNVKAIIYMVVFVLLIIAVVPRIGELKNSFNYLAEADLSWILVAVGAAIATYFAAAVTYVILARVPLGYFKTVAVQVAASFTNRIIPGGIGGLGLNVDYLYKNGHNGSEATSVTAVNSAAAFISYVILLFTAVTISKTSYSQLLDGKSIPPWIFVVVFVVIVAASVTLYYWKSIRAKLVKLIIDAWQNILEYRHEPFRIVLAVLGASLVTVFYVAALYASAHAVGMSVTILQAFLAYTIGMLVGVAIPTPGGLGGVEAGLYAGFVAFGYDPATTLSAIIIYRLMTFWLPILPGYVSFWLLQRKKFI